MTRPSITGADVVVLGAGLAGTALAARLADAPGATGRVVVVDPRDDWPDDRTWCWFDRPGAGPQHLVDRTWSRWSLSSAGPSGACRVVHEGGDAMAYHRVPARRVWDDHLTRIERSDDVELLTGATATAVRRSADGRVEVDTDAGTLLARTVVDTRPPTREQVAGTTLLQVFLGAEVTVDRPVFDPGTVGLMERLTADEHGLRFDYVLPTSPTTALVEATRFAPAHVDRQVLEVDLDRAVAAATGGAAVELGRREWGVLPMGLPGARAPDVHGVVRAGTAAGALRPATGYGFRRILAWAGACAASLRVGGPAIGHPADPPHLAAMDATFLRALRRDPAAGAEWFVRLADALPAGAFGRFMSEQATAADLLRVVGALPPGPLLAAAGRQAARLPLAPVAGGASSAPTTIGPAQR